MLATYYDLFAMKTIHTKTVMYLLIVASAFNLVGFLVIARMGWRPHGADSKPKAVMWSRLRLMLLCFVALSLTTVTHWNVTLSVQQRLAGEAVEARILALSVVPGRPVDSHNAAILYEPILRRLSNQLPDRYLDGKGFGRGLSEKDDPVDKEFLSKHRRELDALVEASRLPQCYFGVAQPRDFLNGHSWIEPMRLAGLVLALDTQVKIAEKDLQSALHNTLALFRLANHLEQSPVFLAGGTSGRFEALGIQYVEELINHPNVSAELLSELQLGVRADYQQRLRRRLVYDEFAITTIVGRIPAEGLLQVMGEVHGEGFNQFNTLQALFLLPFTTTYPYFIERDLEMLSSHFHQYRSAVEQPWPVAINQLKQIQGALKDSGYLSESLLPPVMALNNTEMLRDVRYHLCRLAIAVRRYELDKGKLPKGTEDLVPTYLKEIPLDPTNNKEFEMEVVAGETRLYSREIDQWNLERKDGFYRYVSDEVDVEIWSSDAVEILLKERVALKN